MHADGVSSNDLLGPDTGRSFGWSTVVCRPLDRVDCGRKAGAQPPTGNLVGVRINGQLSLFACSVSA
jgi:hypothetical protein